MRINRKYLISKIIIVLLIFNYVLLNIPKGNALMKQYRYKWTEYQINSSSDDCYYLINQYFDLTSDTIYTKVMNHDVEAGFRFQNIQLMSNSSIDIATLSLYTDDPEVENDPHSFTLYGIKGNPTTFINASDFITKAPTNEWERINAYDELQGVGWHNISVTYIVRGIIFNVEDNGVWLNGSLGFRSMGVHGLEYIKLRSYDHNSSLAAKLYIREKYHVWTYGAEGYVKTWRGYDIYKVNMSLNSIIDSLASGEKMGFARQDCIFKLPLFYLSFYTDGTNLVYKTSENGLTWSSKTAVRACDKGYEFAIDVDYQSGIYYVHYGYSDMDSESDFYYRRGRIFANRTIVWTDEVVADNSPERHSFVDIQVDSDHQPNIVWDDYHGGRAEKSDYARSSETDGTWTTEYGGILNSKLSSQRPSVITYDSSYSPNTVHFITAYAHSSGAPWQFYIEGRNHTTSLSPIDSINDVGNTDLDYNRKFEATIPSFNDTPVVTWTDDYYDRYFEAIDDEGDWDYSNAVLIWNTSNQGYNSITYNADDNDIYVVMSDTVTDNYYYVIKNGTSTFSDAALMFDVQDFDISAFELDTGFSDGKLFMQYGAGDGEGYYIFFYETSFTPDHYEVYLDDELQEEFDNLEDAEDWIDWHLDIDPDYDRLPQLGSNIMWMMGLIGLGMIPLSFIMFIHCVQQGDIMNGFYLLMIIFFIGLGLVVGWLWG